MPAIRHILFALCGAMLIPAAHAEPMYIHDKLVVSVYAQADQESDKIGTVESGDAIEALEKVELYTRVRLSDDREGWIKSSYLSAQPPAIVRLRELEKERAAAPAAGPSPELEALKAENAALQTEVATLKQAATSAPPPTPPPAIGGYLEGEAASTPTLPLWQHVSWGGAVLAAGVALGFTWGYQVLARRIRRKYGNVKIY